MSTNRIDTISLLATADPAAGLTADPIEEAQVWSTVAGVVHGGRPDGAFARHRGRGPGRGRLGRLSLAGLAGALLLGGVALASGLIPLGSPAKTLEQFQIPTSGLGAVTPGSATGPVVSTPDPRGGAPWGLRTFSTSRGAGCVQVGRVVDGQIGALGADGAFGNDGRLHPLPVASTDQLACVALDGNGHIFDSVSKSDQLENALDGPEEVPTPEHPEAHEVCVPAIATAAEKSGALGRICPQSEERNLYYGLLGPSAESVTYLDEGRAVTLPTTGPNGAYLIVTDATEGWKPNAFGPGATGSLPVDGPISEIHYSNGTVCQMTGSGWGEGCTPNGLPVGFVPAAATPTAAQAAATVTATAVQGTAGRSEALVQLKAPLAISSVRDQYKVQWKRPGADPAEGSVNISEGDVQAGEELSVRTGPLPAGATTLQVVLAHATGPALFEGAGTVEVPVGEATVTVP